MFHTKLMGILNVTPDSFFDGYLSLEKAILRGEQLANEGADFIDIGGESTRPNATPISEEEELRRVLPVIQELKKRVAIPLSIDTMKPNVAKAALDAGVEFINDVSGFRDPEMIELAASSQTKICVMHMPEHPHYPEGIIPHLLAWFEKRVEQLIRKGVKEKNIYLDPGIGAGKFGKTVTENLDILRKIRTLKELGFPLLVGISRKSFMGKLVDKPSKALRETTLVLNALLAREEVEILRVHDVKEHRRMLEEICEAPCLTF